MGVYGLPYGYGLRLFAREGMGVLTQWSENGRCTHPGYQASARPALPHRTALWHGHAAENPKLSFFLIEKRLSRYVFSL